MSKLQRLHEELQLLLTGRVEYRTAQGKLIAAQKSKIYREKLLIKEKE